PSAPKCRKVHCPCFEGRVTFNPASPLNEVQQTSGHPHGSFVLVNADSQINVVGIERFGRLCLAIGSTDLVEYSTELHYREFVAVVRRGRIVWFVEAAHALLVADDNNMVSA
ncbi:hypothetical protein VSX64_14845, partial [Aurantimonas sp. C2-6-R+9]|uniref:hypothetical protein n=1 Tax=Aurantimonas sp. C2-6-R+9 TaxID=3114365 RepID=UPI002E18523F|nr:hypothetical protein [Aurantimonas sp. C2-6-R+9]